MKHSEWKHDLKSSLVVFLVALPLCLGIALASNAPLASGLISGIVGGIVIGFFSGSAISVSGPAAGLTVIVASGIAQVGGFEIFGIAVFLAGVIQILFGLLKGGAIGDYFPTAVIKGMLAAIGILIIIKQAPNAIGWNKTTQTINYSIIFISVVSLAIMLTWEKMAYKGITFFKLVPGALIAVTVAILLHVFILHLDLENLVQLPFTGGFSEIFGGIKAPIFSALSNMAVIQLAFTIAIVASLETLLCIDAADKVDPEKRKTSKNRELLAQGIGNVLNGLLGGLPATAVIVRTSANLSAGAKSKLSAIFHGLWILLCVAFIPGVLNMIPLATLACVLLLVGYKLTKPVFFVEMKKRGTDQLIIFSATIVAIVATDLLKGIIIGLVVAILFEMRKPSIVCVDVKDHEDKVVVKFIRNASFYHKAAIAKIFHAHPPHKKLHIHGLKDVRVHVDVHELINDFHEDAKKRGITVELS